MRPFEGLMPFPEALARALEASHPVEGAEAVALDAACGRVSFGNLLAAGDQPPMAKAAMDGYAVSTLSFRETLSCAGSSHAGSPFGGRLPEGACVEIATGAAMPEGADAVVMVEETTREGDRVRFSASPVAGQNVSPRGEDVRAGDVLVPSGAFLHPGLLAAAAAAGAATLDVLRLPVVAHATGGDEVAPPGGELRGKDGVFDANSTIVSALARAHGAEARALGIVPDTVPALQGALGRARGADLVVFSGGTSVGPKDFTLDALGGGDVLFRGVAVKPGRPTILARLADGRLFLGLPGYPVSCLVMAHAFLVPMLRRMARLQGRWGRREALPLAEPWPAVGKLHTFLTVRVGPEGVRRAFRKSSTITSVSRADGIVELPVGTPAKAAGDRVEVVFL